MADNDEKWVKRAAVVAGVGATGIVGILSSNPPEKPKLAEPVPHVQKLEADPNAPPPQRLADLPVPEDMGKPQPKPRLR